MSGLIHCPVSHRRHGHRNRRAPTPEENPVRPHRLRTALAALTPIAALAAPLVVSTPAHAAAGLPKPDHLVVVIEENHSYSSIIGSSSAPYINSLASQGASFTQSFAITHPSEPNYLALYAG